MATDFTRRDVPALRQQGLFRLGLAPSYGIDEKGIEEGLERCQYVFWNPRASRMTPPLQRAVKRDRARYVVAGGPTLAYFPGQLARYVDRTRKLLDTDYLDVLQLYWFGKMSRYTPRMEEELVRLRDSGAVKALAVSIHDRPEAGRLAEESPLDVLMIRYNAAHPGAEQDVFPRLEKRHPAIVAYTATSWRKLLSPPRGWTGPVMTAGDCYRFCLSSPHVDLVLTGPKNVSELRENLRALEKGPLDEDEQRWMRELGRKVHG
ncbi:MAG TPA: aldo/keto reductase [Anaeromyxobacteraceae bacterium]|nr:aldo/keto reductase [Anaeromyxobacteraceae bacterium]